MSLKKYFNSIIPQRIKNRPLGLSGLLVLALMWGSSAYAESCDPVISGGYVGKGTYSAIFSSCTSTVSAVENTVSIKYNPVDGGIIDKVIALPDKFIPAAPASTASIGIIKNDEYYAQDMGPRFTGDCTDMRGSLHATPAAVSGHTYCFRFVGSAGTLYLRGLFGALDAFSSGKATILLDSDFITTWKTDNPGSSTPSSITIPMVGGSYDVDWENDGVFEDVGLSGPNSHTYGGPGTYTVRIRGSYDSIQFNNGGDKEKILSIDQWGANTWTSMNAAFWGAINLTVPAIDIPDFSAVTEMYAMFQGAILANPDTGGWDVSAVKGMREMFRGATSADPHTGSWDTSEVMSMHRMFRDATSANPNTGGWDVASVTTMYGMFRGATSASPETSLWDTSAVTNMTNMFWDATSANPATSGWNTSEVKTMNGMFRGATSADPDTSNWDTSAVTNMSTMFYGATSANPDTLDWDTSKVTDMGSMFWGATSADPDTSGWDTAAVTKMNGMFYTATSANPDTSAWNTAAVTTMTGIFQGATSATPDTGTWDTAEVTIMGYMFAGATSADPDTSAWDTAAVTDMRHMFHGASLASPDTTDWDTTKVTNMSYMFQDATSFDRDIGSWDVTALLDATDMFTGVTLSTANYDSLLVGWNAQVLQPDVIFGGGNSMYCSEAAIASRDNMIASDSWVITDGGESCPVSTFTVGGNVSGLAGSGLILQNNTDDDLAISANGGFTFDTALNDGSAYVVTILTQPSNPAQLCNVSNGSGTLDGADVVDVSVVCEAVPDTIFADGFEE